MNMTENDRKRANFSALSNTNGAVIKMTTNTGTGKPGDIKKIVIKNFRGENFPILILLCFCSLGGLERGFAIGKIIAITRYVPIVIFVLFGGAIAFAICP